LGQTLHIHLEEYAPGGKSQKHGHVNEAVFYILDARRRSARRRALRVGSRRRGDRPQQLRAPALQPQSRPAGPALVMKTKPMYVFMNMLFQKMIEKTPKDPSPTQAISGRAKSRCPTTTTTTITRTSTRTESSAMAEREVPWMNTSPTCKAI